MTEYASKTGEFGVNDVPSPATLLLLSLQHPAIRSFSPGLAVRILPEPLRKEINHVPRMLPGNNRRQDADKSFRQEKACIRRATTKKQGE